MPSRRNVYDIKWLSKKVNSLLYEFQAQSRKGSSVSCLKPKATINHLRLLCNLVYLLSLHLPSLRRIQHHHLNLCTTSQHSLQNTASTMFNNLNSQRRTHESPMDWEWQNQAPVDPNSPFPQYKPQQGQPKRRFTPSPRSPKQ